MLFKALVLLAASAALVWANVKPDGRNVRYVPNWVRSGLIIVAAIVLFPLLDSLGIVAAGDTGVVTQFGGVVMGELKREGLYMVPPGIQQVHVLDTKPHKVELEHTEAVTSDRQEVHTSVALIVQVDPATADQTYREYRDSIVDQVVMPKFQEAVKTVTAKYDAQTQYVTADSCRRKCSHTFSTSSRVRASSSGRARYRLSTLATIATTRTRSSRPP